MKLRLMAALLLVGTAAAEETDAKATQRPTAPGPVPTLTPPPAATPSKDETSSTMYDGDHFGLQIDAGVPVGAAAALVYRPWYFLRVNAGVATDIIGFGFKGGVTLIPFHWAVVPTLGLEAGHFFQGDATKFGKPSDPALAEVLKSVGYDYLSADVGLEFGSQNRFVFYVRGGLTQVYPSTSNFQAALQAANLGRTIQASDPTLSARGPSVRLGFILYLF